MKNIKTFIVIPVFNDYKSLNKLLKNLDKILKKRFKDTHILIINDNSSEKMNVLIGKFISLKKIEVLNLSKNVGSQKAIATGLLYLKKKKGDFIITILDSDGEDDPMQVPKMIRLAKANPDHVITSNRKSRKESKIIIFLYNMHLFLTFLFTFKWISFGNFSSFKKKNLSRLLTDNSSSYAHSSAVMKNCSILRVYAKRKKRYFDKSKLSLFSLVQHSLRVNAVFFKKVVIFSAIYIFLAVVFFSKVLALIIIFTIIIFNFLVLFMRLKFRKEEIDYWKKKIF